MRTIPLAPQSVAAFYRQVMEMLRAEGIEVRIWKMPVEIPNPIPFDQDETHGSYDRAAVEKFWQILLSANFAFDEFRSGFIGKCSPVHFFWGSFDLAVTRFSGRRAPSVPAPIPSPAKPIRTKSAVSASGLAQVLAIPHSTLMPHRNRRGFQPRRCALVQRITTQP